MQSVNLCFVQISESEINFWRSNLQDMQRRHEIRSYPPRIKMSVIKKTTDPIKLPVKVEGCVSTASRPLDVELVIPGK